ncbi:MAG: hypothetical protein C4291_10850 [Candidatus Dadabacteria bacterium]
MEIIRTRIYRLSIIAVILASFTPVSLISKSAECAMIGSQLIPLDGKTSVREIDIEKIRRALENKIVAEKLKGYGLSKEEVMAKIDKMSDGQIHQIATLSDKIPTGGDAALGVLITILVFVVLILLILFLLKVLRI